EKCWSTLKDIIRTKGEELASFYLLGSLNFIDANEAEIAELLEFVNRVKGETLKRELLVYLSFLKHIENCEIVKGGDIDSNVVECSPDRYLASYSTEHLAYDYYFDKMKQLKEEEKWKKMFHLVETVLRYHPGDDKIFEFLDALVKA
ncbi:MAG: hypothetical protein GY757_43240, partial [bacterium]|nr:hypothetical protein [bacterium]